MDTGEIVRVICGFFVMGMKQVKPEENLRALANSIIDSYEMRVKTVNELMAQAYHFLTGFQNEVEEMMVQVRDNLARSENLRKKDFNRMMADLTEKQQARESEAKQAFYRFQEEEKGMIDRLREIMVSGGRANPEAMEVIREDILKRQKEREADIVRVLKRFQIEQEEVKSALKMLLEKGESVRVRDFKRMLKALRVQQVTRESMDGMLEDLDRVRYKVQSQWDAVSGLSPS